MRYEPFSWTHEVVNGLGAIDVQGWEGDAVYLGVGDYEDPAAAVVSITVAEARILIEALESAISEVGFPDAG